MSDRQCLHLGNIGEIMSFHILIIFWGHSMQKLKKTKKQMRWSRKQFGIEMAELKLDRCMNDRQVKAVVWIWNSSVTDWQMHEWQTVFAFRKYWRNYEFSYSYNLLGSLHEKTKKTLRKPKKLKKPKKTIFSDSSGVTPWKNQKKPWENQKKPKKQKKTIFSDSLGGGPSR